MKTIYSLLLMFCITLTLVAQTYKTETIFEQRNHYLNGGFNASMGGQSRVVIKIDLPANTEKWYYSFTTSPGESGTEILNLGIQVTAAVSTIGASTIAASQLKVPAGSGAIEVYVLAEQYRDAFLNKDDENWRYYADVSVEKSKQAVSLPIDASYGKSLYLGIRNPSSMDGINVFIEAVAVVKEVDAEADKGAFYGSLGWKAYEKGELDKCVEYSTKALSYNPNLTWVKFNIALVHLIKNDSKCIDEYVETLTMSKNDKNPKVTLTGVFQDLEDLTSKYNYSDLKYLSDIKEIVSNELSKY